MNTYRTIQETDDSVETTYEIQKSRFITHVCHVENEEDARAFVQSMKKRYFDARHNCSAWVLGELADKQKSNDDGEPGGTAGNPILEAIKKNELTDVAIVVTNPEVSSVRDSDRILGILAAKSRRALEKQEPVKEHLLITRYAPSRVDKGEMLSVEDIQDILRIPLIGVIPESMAVLQASNQGMPVIHLTDTDVAEAYKDVVARFLGAETPMRFLEAPKVGLLKRLFGG